MRTAGPLRHAVLSWCRAAFQLDVRSLAVFRMAVGAILCCDALLRTRDFRIMFAGDGLFPIDVLRGYQNDPTVWSLCFVSDSLAWQAVVLAVEGLAGCALALGFHTRYACFVAWVATVSVVRRTAPAANAGDIWLVALLFWGLFLPLGRVWSIDARRVRTEANGPAWAVPLVLQIAAVYLSAGLSKWNVGWFSGEAVMHALSVHDHGTPLGERLAELPWLSPMLSWSVLSLELLGPVLLVAVPLQAVRLGLVITFVAFHAGIAFLMTVGLFAPIGMAAWMAIVPGFVWDRASRRHGSSERSRFAPRPGEIGRPSPASMAQALFVAISAATWLHAAGPWKSTPLPAPVVSIANLACLPQQWIMFGDVPGQRQWVYGRAELADGRMVDLLRGGRPLELVHPEGGFTTLPHHRWHKIFWELPKPPMRVFSPTIAAAIARDWNARHQPAEHVRSLEIRYARLPTDGTDATFHELLLATWPDRGGRGHGNLERFLEAHE